MIYFRLCQLVNKLELDSEAYFSFTSIMIQKNYENTFFCPLSRFRIDN